jgi:hypothetical protein
MQAGNSHRIRRAAVAVTAVAALTAAGVSGVGAGSARASIPVNWAPTYTCDTFTNWGPNPDAPQSLEIEGDGNCVASNGAPDNPSSPFVPIPVSLAARSDSTVYHCSGPAYVGVTLAELPIKVLGMLCVPAS